MRIGIEMQKFEEVKVQIFFLYNILHRPSQVGELLNIECVYFKHGGQLHPDMCLVGVHPQALPYTTNVGVPIKKSDLIRPT